MEKADCAISPRRSAVICRDHKSRAAMEIWCDQEYASHIMNALRMASYASFVSLCKSETYLTSTIWQKQRRHRKAAVWRRQLHLSLGVILLGRIFSSTVSRLYSSYQISLTIMSIVETALNDNTRKKSLILNAFVETCRSSRSNQSVVLSPKGLIDGQAVDISHQVFGAIQTKNRFDSMM